MESIVVSFQELLNCPPFLCVMAFGIVLGVLEVLYADKCGYGAYCKVTFKYRMPRAPHTAESLQSTMLMLSLVAITMPLAMLILYEGYDGIFMLLWWALFLGVSIVTQWLFLIVLIVYVMYSETRRRNHVNEQLRTQ